MSLRTKIFTAYENTERTDPAEQVELVREGFSWLAFLFSPVWLMVNRMWIETFGFFLLAVGLVRGGAMLHLPAVTVLLFTLLLHLIVGFSAYDLKRGALARRGFRFTGVVAAETALNAQRRYYDYVA